MLLCVLVTEPVPAPISESVESILLETTPRLALDPPYAWLDARGLDVSAVHVSLRHRLKSIGVRVRCGAGPRPVTAQVAARLAEDDQLVHVPRGCERDFLAPQSLEALGMEDPLHGWLADIGIATCGELASIEREALEVRFGAEAVRWWRLARGDDERRLFMPEPPEQPNASVDFVDYVVTDPDRLIFTTNALLGGLCEQMRERGSHACRLSLRLPLANGAVWERTLKTARPTADRAAWLRLARALLEKLTVPDAVAGVSVQVEATEAAGSVQGDLFDAGFATATAVETAVSRLIENQGDVLLEPVVNAHPPDGPVGLTLQLLPDPRAVTVESVRRRDHVTPVRYHDGQWYEIVHAAGPDRVSGGQWDVTYAREYFRAVTADGALVWLFRDAGRDRWYLHGWWD